MTCREMSFVNRGTGDVVRAKPSFCSVEKTNRDGEWNKLWVVIAFCRQRPGSTLTTFKTEKQAISHTLIVAENACF